MRGGPSARKGVRKVESTGDRERVACVFHSIWYFFHNAYAQSTFSWPSSLVLAAAGTIQRPLARSIPTGRSSLKSRGIHLSSFFERENLPIALSSRIRESVPRNGGVSSERTLYNDRYVITAFALKLHLLLLVKHRCSMLCVAKYFIVYLIHRNFSSKQFRS